MPALFAAGATLQAGVGAALVRRFVRQPLTLAEPVDVAHFFAAGIVSSLISASVATAALAATRLVAAAGSAADLGHLVGRRPARRA